MSVPSLRPVTMPADHAFRRGLARGRPKLGQMLVDRGALSSADQLRALALQGRVDARYGDILIAHGLIDKDLLYATLAQQYGTDHARLDVDPPDAALVDALGIDRCLALGLLPWKRVRGVTHIATARPEGFNDVREELAGHFGRLRMVIAAETDLHRAILAINPRCLAHRAETRVSADFSCRDWKSRRVSISLATLFLAALAGVALAPRATLVALFAVAVLTLLANTALKAAAAIAQVLAQHRQRAQPDPATQPTISRLPVVSILVPLFRECEIAQRLIARLTKLTYPRELLDICLVVEAEDDVTRNAIEAMRLPSHIRQIVVPDSRLKTKPRALNYALDFCRGAIVGVYDAEDAPEPDQIQRIVQRFHERGPDVACLQGVIDFYNARANWLSRCFAIEYATWFRVILPGLTRLGLVIPLGGTTLFFRRSALEELGGWDAHNVTEDADLGVRLARRGYRTELIDTVTEEEANARVWPWVRQRSRWLKGYSMTWSVHMRSPARLWRDLGPWRFTGIQVLFLGTIAQFLLAPLLWSFWLIPLGLDHPLADILPPGALVGLAAMFLASEAVNIAVSVYGVRARMHWHLIPFVPTLHLYFPLAALASYKGVVELLTRPFYWDKTTHGLFDTGDEALAEAIPPQVPRRRRA